MELFGETLTFLVLVFSTVVSVTSFLFVSYHSRFKKKELIFILFIMAFIQIFWQYLPEWSYDLVFVMLSLHLVKENFNIIGVSKNKQATCQKCPLKSTINCVKNKK